MLFLLGTHVLLYWFTSLGYILEVDPLRFEQRLPGRYEVSKVLFNQLVITPSFVSMLPDLHSLDVPSPLLLTCYLMLHSIYLFNVHLMMHRIPCLARAHSVHHRVSNTLPYRALFCSPIEHAVLNLGSFFIGPVLVGYTPVAIAAWVIVGTIATCYTHSGALRYGSSKHGLHHILRDVNFSSGLSFMDKLAGNTG